MLLSGPDRAIPSLQLGGKADNRFAVELAPVAAMVAATDAKANITAALLRNAELEAQPVEVRVDGTEIQLTGQVTSWAARQQAEFAAWCTPGVTHVDNRLAITE